MNIKKIYLFFIVVFLTMFLYSFFYFFYFNFSLKTEPDKLTLFQKIFYLSYWISLFIVDAIYFLFNMIYYSILIYLKRSKRAVKNLTNIDTQKELDIEIFSFWLFIIFTSFLSLLNLVYYNSVTIEGGDDWHGLFLIVSMMYTTVTIFPLMAIIIITMALWYDDLRYPDQTLPKKIENSNNVSLINTSNKKTRGPNNAFQIFFIIIFIFSLIYTIYYFVSLTKNSYNLNKTQLDISIIYLSLVFIIYLVSTIIYYVPLVAKLKKSKKTKNKKQGKNITLTFTIFLLVFLVISILNWIYAKIDFDVSDDLQYKKTILDSIMYTFIFTLPITFFSLPFLLVYLYN